MREFATAPSMSGRCLFTAFVATAVIVLAFAGSTSATTKASGKIYACVKKTSGAVRVVTATTRCRSGERKLSWNSAGARGAAGTPGPPGARGPTGLRGPQGVQGAKGDRGATGATGPTASQVVTGTPKSTALDPAVGTTLDATATCPADTALLGGGGKVSNDEAGKPQKTVLVQTYPSSGTAWTAVGVVTFDLPGAAKMTVQAYAICST